MFAECLRLVDILLVMLALCFVSGWSVVMLDVIGLVCILSVALLSIRSEWRYDGFHFPEYHYAEYDCAGCPHAEFQIAVPVCWVSLY